MKTTLILFLAALAGCQAPTAGSGTLSITGFQVAGSFGSRSGSVDNSARTLTAAVPYGTDVAGDILPLIKHTGTLTPEDNTFTDFSHPVIYTVTDSDGSHADYTATVTVEAAPKAVTAFSFDGLEGAVGTINSEQGTVAVTVPKGTDVTHLAPTIVFTGAGVAPASGAAEDFSQPVAYTVTGADGQTKVYTVTVTPDPLSNAKDITAFTFSNVTGHLVVAMVGTDIGVGVPGGTNVTALVPDITFTGVSVTPPSGVARNFTNPVVFTVRAENGTTKAYTVEVTVN